MRVRRLLPREDSARTGFRFPPSDLVEHSGSHPCVRLVVVEDGTNDTEDHALPSGAGETVFISQGGGERAMDFAQRVSRHISALEHAHRSIVSTFVLLSPRFDSEATAARLALAHKLMAHSAAALGSSELLLSAGSELDPRLQSKVVAFADLLVADPAGNTLLVTVQFTTSGDPRVRLILGGSATARHEDLRTRGDAELSDLPQLRDREDVR